MLDKQINLFKIDTNAFLLESEKEQKKYLSSLHKKNKDLLSQKRQLKKDNKDFSEIDNELNKLSKEIKEEKKEWKEFLLKSSKDNVEYNDNNSNKRIRELDKRFLYYFDEKDNQEKTNLSNVVSMFESTLSRSFDIKTNELTEDIFIVDVYYFDIAQDLIVNGFNYNNKHYVYFSSSAGQIRTKKAVFVEESKYNNRKPKLMCGLTLDKINELGGMNVNKFLAYLALSNSATELWYNIFEKDFDIDKCIVVDDFETMVKCKVDNINYETYEITPNVEQDMPIPHTDGCGMILSSYSNKNFMVRLPWIKGLLGSFDFRKFIEVNQCSSVVEDIWGQEYDIIKDDIQIIFTKSQLKMYKYYSNWNEYKNYFKQYNCEACVCNMEEDTISNAKINYQMLQTLYDMTKEEVKDICKYPNKNILDVSNSLENMLKFFYVFLNEDNIENNRDWFQKSLRLYPELLQDTSNKENLKDLRNSLVKRYKGGKLNVMGKFTFVLPDLYAFCEKLFMNIETPKGLLENNEVFCRLYKNSKELDCLRSPSLYIEHAIRNNVCNKKYRNQKLADWYCTDAIYTSTYDLISRILQFDVDGDRLLILSQKKIIEIAKRCMQGVNPLYYEMKKAKAEILTPKSMYNGLKLAFVGGNIGIISNDITKIWNQPQITEDELKAVRWLCMETNFTIDYAKTLFKPTRPKKVDEILKKYHNMKVPHFFYYAKDYDKDKTDKINDSTLNKIVKEIKTNKMMFNSIKNLGQLDYLMLLKDKQDLYSNDDINKKYVEWNRKYGNNLNIDEDDNNKNNIKFISIQLLSELHEIENDDNKIINSLVKFLYKKDSTRKKKLLWYIYGEQLYNNLLENIDDNTEVCMKCGKRVKKGILVNNKCRQCREKEIKCGVKIIKCIDCGEEFEVSSKNTKTCRCKKCQEKIKKNQNKKIQKNKYYMKKFLNGEIIEYNNCYYLFNCNIRDDEKYKKLLYISPMVKSNMGYRFCAYFKYNNITRIEYCKLIDFSI